MLTFALVSALGFAALLAWHMQRPDPPRLRLSFARFLPDPPLSTTRQSRLALRLPWRSAGFWLRMLAALSILAAFLPGLLAQRLAAPGIGLRLVVDVTDSMGLADGSGSRLDSAVAAAREILEQAKAAALDGPFCAEAQMVGANAVGRLGDAETVLVAAQVRPEGGDPEALLAAAGQPAAACPITHAAILTDRPAPAGLAPETGRKLAWRQVGAAVENSGLRSVAYLPSGLAGRGASLHVAVARFGTGAPPRLLLDGPGGSREIVPDRSLDRDDLWLAQIPAPGMGRYRLSLQDGGLYRGDDVMVFDLPDSTAIPLDWRIDELRLPRGARQDPGGIVVAPVGEGAGEDRPALLTWPGWASGGRPGRIGSFLDDKTTTGALNFDVLEQAMPFALPDPLPSGFVPIMTDEAGGVLVARRTDPPGLVLPAPETGQGETVEALSLSLFFAGLSDLASGPGGTVTAAWQDGAGRVVSEAWKESDTNRPLAGHTALDFSPLRAEIGPPPVSPWLALVGLAFLIAERFMALVGLRRRGAARAL